LVSESAVPNDIAKHCGVAHHAAACGIERATTAAFVGFGNFDEEGWPRAEIVGTVTSITF
jgi:hypothetical protein